MPTSNPGTARARLTWVNLNTLLGALLFFISIVFIFYLVPQYINEPPRLNNPMLSPRWLPAVAGWIVLVLSVLLFIEGCLAPPLASGIEQERAPAQRWLLLAVALAVYMLCFELLGAMAAGIVATLILFAAHPIRQPWIYLLGIVLPVAVTLLFVHLLNVPLPVGQVWE
ncbi:tripartite tricarboxylate transporter TctB family protein [Halomonas sp. WWR20]